MKVESLDEIAVHQKTVRQALEEALKTNPHAIGMVVYHYTNDPNNEITINANIEVSMKVPVKFAKEIMQELGTWPKAD